VSPGVGARVGCTPAGAFKFLTLVFFPQVPPCKEADSVHASPLSLDQIVVTCFLFRKKIPSPLFQRIFRNTLFLQVFRKDSFSPPDNLLEFLNSGRIPHPFTAFCAWGFIMHFCFPYRRPNSSPIGNSSLLFASTGMSYFMSPLLALSDPSLSSSSVGADFSKTS